MVSGVTLHFLYPLFPATVAVAELAFANGILGRDENQLLRDVFCIEAPRSFVKEQVSGMEPFPTLNGESWTSKLRVRQKLLLLVFSNRVLARFAAFANHLAVSNPASSLASMDSGLLSFL